MSAGVHPAYSVHRWPDIARKVISRFAIYDWLVIAIVIATRLPLVGNYYGEPDTARYAFGLRFWIASGPHAGSIINSDLSAGYYWLAAHLATAANIPYESFALLLSGLSFAASIVLAWALFRLGAMVVSRTVAFVATLLTLLGPSAWWAGIEGHPQALAAAAVLSSMLCFAHACRTHSPVLRSLATAASAAAFAVSLLMKSDFILLALAYAPLALLLDSVASTAFAMRRLWRAGGYALPALVPGYLLFVAAKSQILSGAPAAGNEAAVAHINRFLSLPTGIAFIEQAAPIFFSHGIFLILLAASGAVAWFITERGPTRLPWGLFVAAWILPQYCFWLLIRGNNVRHLLLAPIPLFWLAAVQLQKRGTKTLAIATLCIIAADVALPPNSGANIFPSPNVPASARLLRAKQQRLQEAAQRLMSGSEERSCYFGMFTIDHVSAFLLADVDRAGMREKLLTNSAFRIAVYRADGSLFRYVDVLAAPLPPQPTDTAECGITDSVEYAGHQRIRYFGAEWQEQSFRASWLGKLLR